MQLLPISLVFGLFLPNHGKGENNMSNPDYDSFCESHFKDCQACQERLELQDNDFQIEDCLDFQKERDKADAMAELEKDAQAEAEEDLSEQERHPRPEDVYGPGEML